MADFLLELVSEEIPARMQADAGQNLARLVETKLMSLGVWNDASTITGYCTSRHLLAYATDIAVSQPDQTIEKRGPRTDASEAAVAGFLNSAGIERSALIEKDTPKGRFFFARSEVRGRTTKDLLVSAITELLNEFPWPKSQRWGRGKFRWVRPLHRINLLFDGKPLTGTLDLGGGDKIEFGSNSCGHYFEAPNNIDLSGVVNLEDVKTRFRDAFVMIDPVEQQRTILDAAQELASSKLCKVNEAQLGNYLEEIAGLVEWPSLLMGQIEDQFMVLPDELLQCTIETHQKYITLTEADGSFSKYFILLSNRLPNTERDRVIISGNQRVLRARLADAEFFWKEDQARGIEVYLPKLANVTFHEGLGNLYDKAFRIEALSKMIAPYVDAVDPKIAARAARLAKADLVTGLVGQFPELQGIIGGYYAAASGEDKAVSNAITGHYLPRGPADNLPATSTSMVVALADKIDTLVGFFGIDAKPTGSKDPFALRRAALGIIRIIVDGQLNIPLVKVLQTGAKGYGFARVDDDLLPFMRDRLRGYLLEQQMRHDVVAAALSDAYEDDIRLMAARAKALAAFLESPDGDGLMAGWRRVSSILTAEEKKAKTVFTPSSDPTLFNEIEQTLFNVLSAQANNHESVNAQLVALGALHTPIDLFFDKIVVNDSDSKIRLNRLGLLAIIREKMLAVADFSKIEG